MPLYRYHSVSVGKGRKIGSIDAESLQDAKLKLVRMQIPATRVVELSNAQLQIQLSKKELLTISLEMGRLLHAGLPLFETLSAMEEKYRGQEAHELLLDLCDQVRSGQAFSKALARHPRTFDLLYISMIANAEKTGQLYEALNEITHLLSRQLKVKNQLISALLYPSLLGAFCMIVLGSLFFFVIPSLRELFEGRELHPLTRIVFACSAFACEAKFFLLFVFCIMAGMMTYLVTFQKGQRIMHRLLHRMPLFKQLLAKVAFIRFCRSTAALLEGGVDAITAFTQARGVMRHDILERVILQVEERIREGEPLHIPFQNHPLIPPLVPRMIAIAQQGGRLAFMMGQIATIYEEELENYLNRFTALAQPILLLILGGVIGFVLLSVLLPLTDVSSFVT